MKTIHLCCFVLLSIFSFRSEAKTTPTTTSSTTFYISPDGDDSNEGTIDQPWKTIQHGVDEINLTGGTLKLHDTEWFASRA